MSTLLGHQSRRAHTLLYAGADILSTGLFVSLLVLVFSVLLFAPVVVTLDGYSHLYHSTLIRGLAAKDPVLQTYFSFNSFMLPNWGTGLTLAALSIVLPPEWALRIFMTMLAAMSVTSLCYCANLTSRPLRPLGFVILMPFAINAYLTLGFYGFLLSTALSLLAVGLLLRYDNQAPIRVGVMAALLLCWAYYCHPLPVLFTAAVPCILTIVVAITARDGKRAILKKAILFAWPWVFPFLLSVSFSARLSTRAGPPRYSLIGTAPGRAMELLGDSLSLVSPTPTTAALFTALLAVTFCGTLQAFPRLPAQKRRRFWTLCTFVALMAGLYLVVPESVGDGYGIHLRVLMFLVIATVLLAVSSEELPKQVLAVGSAFAVVLVLAFCAEYWLVSSRLAPAVRELATVTQNIPAGSRIVILGYRLSPSCRTWPLLDRSAPERHFALGAAIERGLVVLNDYQPTTSHFPVRIGHTLMQSLKDELSPTHKERAVAWAGFLSAPQSDADFVLSWGTPSGVGNCPDRVPPPLEMELSMWHALVVRREGVSRVDLWRRRSASNPENE